MRFLLLFLLAGIARAETVNLAGSFNDWNPTNAAFAMTSAGNGQYALTQFFRAGNYKFKFAFDGGWTKHLGEALDGTLTQPGKEITLSIPAHGDYRISLATKDRRWAIDPVAVTVPHAVVKIDGAAEVGHAFMLDASESVPRPGHMITSYRFDAGTNAGIVVNGATATLILPVEGTYPVAVTVDDGMTSAPEVVTLKAETSYQFGSHSLERTGPGSFESIIKATNTNRRVYRLVKNYDFTTILTNISLAATRTNSPTYWHIRYDERRGLLRAEAEELVEFRYRPVLDNVESVALVGSFNGWNPSALPMQADGEGTFVKYLKLEDGLHHYKFLVNGNGWVPDPNAENELKEDDGHDGFNSGVFVGERGRDFGAPQTNAVNLAAVRHRPEQTVYLNPLTSEYVELRLRTLQGDVGTVSVLVSGQPPVTMERDEPVVGFDWWTATVTVTNAEIDYSFTLQDGEAVTNLGPFSVTVTNRVTVPEWAEHVVWYQIFADRFRNGTPDNDPPGTLPWRWDWYKCAPGETFVEGKQFSNAWYSRRFGGDLQGVMEKLPYLRELGVTALYFCPIFESGSNHGYDTHDYRHVSRYFGVKEELPVGETLDPATWQWTASDRLFIELVKEAHTLGMKVIIDGVFNHMGKGSFALQDVLTNGVNSVYADWFDVTDWGPPVKYKSWDGGGFLPNFRKNAETGIASESARKYIFDITRRWLEAGIDGWRLDVAPDVQRPFWVEWRKLVKTINPDAYICGEDWGIAASHLQGDEWDATMNYPFAATALNFFVDRERKITASEFDRRLRRLLAARSMPVNLVMQNLYDSHDTDRLVNMIANPDRDYDGCNRPQDGCPYDGSKPGADAYRVMKLMATFQMTFVGAPMIWYGDEVGMFGADDPTDRKPMLWKDLMPYNNPQDFVMNDVWEHYRKLIAIRMRYPALQTGLYRALLTDDANDVFAFARMQGSEVVLVILNNNSKMQTASIKSPWPEDVPVTDALGGNSYKIHAGQISLTLPGKSAAILVR